MTQSNGVAKPILILGGTGEARALAAALVQAGRKVVTSLAGRTANPLLPEGQVRIGGFGGVAGLAAYLRKQQTGLLIDATHPFAAQISANAVAAAKAADVPLVRFERPEWQRPSGAEWIEVEDMAQAAAVLPAGAKVFLAIGRQEIAHFFERTHCRFTARMIEVPETAPGNWTIIAGRGPFPVQAEVDLLAFHGFTHMVAKNSGAAASRDKIEAAAQLGVPVVMVKRPVLPPARSFENVQALLAYIDQAGLPN